MTEIIKEKTATISKKTIIVTSTKTVDFPAHGWGIHAGESRELPEDEGAQKEILSKHYISVKN